MKRFLAITLLCISTMAFTACGGSAEQSGTEPADTQTQTEVETDADAKDSDTEPESGDESEKENVELTVFSGAGLKKPMEDIKSEFEKENPNVKINYIFAGSGQLLSQLELGNKGDVFITGSVNSYDSANEKGLVEPAIDIAHHTPVIAVQKGNPKNIQSLEDLTQPGLKIMVGDEKANAIGMTTQKIIEKNNLPGINDNVISKAATINEIVAQFGATDTVDAAIVTKDSVYHNDQLEIIEIPEDQNVDQIIPICVLKNTEHKDDAQAFVDFVASEKGKEAFSNYGFDPVNQ